MLKIKEVTKIYKTDDYEQKALDNVSLSFRNNEFVSILGASGSGKSTLLNIIGGLDHYTSGDLLIDNISTKDYISSDWDEYRNNKIGFIFQNYNLIGHQSILFNVELALTLSGIKKTERTKRAKEALEKVGLGSHLNKKPSQLSGGQMQRVAIARALVNNPDIVLADEPTGALDSTTSIQIMDLLKEIAKNKLVIMVTHNPDLAKNYSTRIITLKDGQIVSDTKPYDGEEKESNTKEKEKHKTASMSLFTALTLSLHNLETKKGRTTLTAIAGSIGIIGIALILALSNGINKYVDNLQKDSSSYMPLTIEETASEAISLFQTSTVSTTSRVYDENKINTTDNITSNQYLNTLSNSKKNNLQKFRTYLNDNQDNFKKYTSNIEYKYDIDLQIYNTNSDGEIEKVNPQTEDTSTDTTGTSSTSTSVTSLLTTSFYEITSDDTIFNDSYEVVAGKQPENYDELVLVLDANNNIPLSAIYSLGIENKKELASILENAKNKDDLNISTKTYEYSDILDKSYKLILNSNFYEQSGDSWLDKSNDKEFVKKLYNDGVNLKVVGIVRTKTSQSLKTGFMGYTNKLTKYLIENNRDSQIGKAQLNDTSINVFTGTSFDGITTTYENNLKTLGIRSLETPSSIDIYPKDYDNKKQLKKLIEEYNNNVEEVDKITYSDTIESLNKGITDTINMLSYILIAFIAISLIVSSIMISIITYISVLERTKEIGILRAIGASKKDVKRVFKAETIIEGFVSGTLGVLVSLLLILIINIVIKLLAQIDNFASLPLSGALILIAISILLTLFAGSIPADMASKKDPVESLRGE